MGAYRGDDTQYLEVPSLAVAPAHHHQGVGTALLQHALAQAEGAIPWCMPCILCARASNEGAQALYRRQGFSDVATLR